MSVNKSVWVGVCVLCECASVPKSVETTGRNNELPQLFALAPCGLCELCVRKLNTEEEPEPVIVMQLVPSLSVSAGAENSVGALNPSSSIFHKIQEEKLRSGYWTKLHLFPQEQETSQTPTVCYDTTTLQSTTKLPRERPTNFRECTNVGAYTT